MDYSVRYLRQISFLHESEITYKARLYLVRLISGCKPGLTKASSTVIIADNIWKYLIPTALWQVANLLGTDRVLWTENGIAPYAITASDYGKLYVNSIIYACLRSIGAEHHHVKCQAMKLYVTVLRHSVTSPTSRQTSYFPGHPDNNGESVQR